MRWKYKVYTLKEGVRRVKTTTAVAITAVALIIGGGSGLSMMMFGSADAAPPAVIYNNLPSPQPGNVTSEAFEATSTSEFGGQVSFAGTNRTNPTVTVLMSSWGCESGTWFNDDCVTTSGSTFSEPITLNVYNVGASNSVGTPVISQTNTFSIPYRPSANDTQCTGPDGASGYTGSGPNGEWYSSADNTCYNGFATPISFNLNGVTLPDSAIITVAYNTSDYGAQPYGHGTACAATTAGCGYDSLNVGLVNTAPSVGTNPAPDSDYLNSSLSGFYCDNGANGTGTLRYDTGNTGSDIACPYAPAIQVEASSSTVTVTIDKYVDGQQATATNANSTAFPMVSSWSATNIGSGSGSYTLSTVGFNNPNPYYATTSDMSLGADYATNEVTNTSAVSASCDGSAPYALVGYSTGDTLADAQSASISTTSPSFTDLQNDKYVIVWNKTCTAQQSYPTTADQCKNNGWKQFGKLFKNQGDCVSYVVTHGKNQPSGH